MAAMLTDMSSDPLNFLAATFISCLTGIPPPSTLNLAAGLYHGVMKGSVLFLLGAVLAAVATVLLVRAFLRDFVMRKMKAWEPKRLALDAAIAKEGSFTIVALLRLSPAMPLAPASLLLGLTNVGLVPYTLGTLVGLFPFSAVYAYVGSVSGQAAAAGSADSSGKDPTQLALQIAGVVATIGLSWKISKVAQGALDAATGPIRQTARKASSPTRRPSRTLHTEVAPKGARQKGVTLTGKRTSKGGSGSGKGGGAAASTSKRSSPSPAKRGAASPKPSGRRAASPASGGPARLARRTTAEL